MTEQSKIFKEFGYISDYTRWDDIINEKAAHFFELYQVHPNILLASGYTFDRIDNYLRQHPENLVYSGDGEPHPFESLSAFTTADYELEFCLDTDQNENYFVLVYDETPDFGGEEEFETDEERMQYTYRMAG